MRSDSSALAVTMMIGTAAVVGSPRTARQTSRPSMPGSIRSRITASTGLRRSRGITSRPDSVTIDGEAGFFEVVPDQRRDVGVVLGDEDAAHAGRKYTSPL